MLSKEEIEVWIDIMERSQRVYVEVPRVKFLELLRSELSVQEVVENVPSALEFAKEFVAGTPKADFEEHKDQMMDDLRAEVRKRDTLIAAFALKQKGETLAEFDAHVNKCACAPKCKRGQIEGLTQLTPFIEQRVHVTITAPKPLEETR